MSQTAQANLFPAKQPSVQGLWPLPSGWEWVRLDDLCPLIAGGGTPKRGEAKYFGGDIVWITPTDLNVEDPCQAVSTSSTTLTQRGLEESSAKLLPAGTVLFSSRATIGKVAIAGVPLATNQGFVNFICSDRLFNRYLGWALCVLTEEIKKLAGSTTYLEVSRGNLRDFCIPVPFPRDSSRSLDIQRRVVARIEALLAEMKEARALVAAIRHDTDRVMGAAVEEAFDGLEHSKVRHEPLGSLLQAKPQYGLSEKASDSPPGIPILRMGNIVGGEVRLNDLKFVELSPAEEIKYLVGNGDILFNRTNSAELVGKSAVYESSERVVFASYLIRLVADQQKARPRFLVAYINSLCGRAYIQSQLTRAIGQVNVNAQKLAAMLVPVPDLKEQDQICEYLAGLKQEVNEMRRLQAQDAELIDQLEQSILERAFQGEL